MALEVDELLAPVQGKDPAGPDLAYDAVRSEIERAFEASVSIDASGEPEVAADVDWPHIISLIERQSAQTKDVWLAVYLCRAGARAGRLQLVATGAEYLAGLLERYWDNVHPQLEDYGFQGRNGPCQSLTRVGEFLGPLERAVVLEHPRLGRFTAADFERYRASGQAEEGYGVFQAALKDTPEETLATAAAAADRIAEALRRADLVLTDKGGAGEGANFQATYDLLRRIHSAVLSFTTRPPEAIAPGEAAPGGEAPTAGAPRAPGRIESREEVLRALEEISDYYRRREPGSPVPLMTERARQWVGLDFLGILQDIAPDSLDAVRRVLLFQRPEGE
jgi:type VI secretion system protein ImpA